MTPLRAKCLTKKDVKPQIPHGVCHLRSTIICAVGPWVAQGTSQNRGILRGKGECNHVTPVLQDFVRSFTLAECV